MCLWTGAACNAVFGLDELRPDDGDPDLRQATFARDRLTASAATLESRTPASVRYLVRAPGEPSGYASYPATFDGASASATVPAGPYLLEVSFTGTDRLYVASDAATFAYRDQVYGRADLDTEIPSGTTVSFSLTASRWDTGSELTYDTFGMWSHAQAGNGPVTASGTTLTWTLSWSGNAVATPPATPLGLLSPSDHVALTHREASPTGGAWSVTEGLRAIVLAPQTGGLAYIATLEPVDQGRVDATVVGDPVARANGAAPPIADCAGTAQVRAVPWAGAGNRWGVGLGQVPLESGAVSVAYGSGFPLPAEYVHHLVTTVECPYMLGGTSVAVSAEMFEELDDATTPTVALPIPFAVGFEVAGVPLASTTNTVPLPTGAVTVRWTPEPSLPAPDLYSVVVAALGSAAPEPVFTALTGQPSIDVPAGLIEPGGNYVVLVTAAIGYPGFRAGDLAASGPVGSTTTPSPPFVIPSS